MAFTTTKTPVITTNSNQSEFFITEEWIRLQEAQAEKNLNLAEPEDIGGQFLVSKVEKAVDEIFRPDYSKERKETIINYYLKSNSPDFGDRKMLPLLEELKCVKKIVLVVTHMLLEHLRLEPIQSIDSSSLFDVICSSSYCEEVLEYVQILKDIHFPCGECIPISLIEKALRDCEKINRSTWVSETVEMSNIVTPPTACYEQGTIYRQIDGHSQPNDRFIFSQSLREQKTGSSTEDFLYVLLNDDLPQNTCDQIIQSLSTYFFVSLLRKTYQKAQGGDGLAARSFCSFCTSRYEYEDHNFQSVVTLENFEKYVRDCFRKLPCCSRKWIEDVIIGEEIYDKPLLLQFVSKQMFDGLLAEELCYASFEKWPSKRKVISSLLAKENLGYRSRFPQILLQSEDIETQVLGKALLAALDPITPPKSRITAFDTIKELLPNLNCYQFLRIFGFFYTYEKPKFTKNKPVCRVNGVASSRNMLNRYDVDTIRAEKYENGKDLLIWEIRLDQLFQGQQVAWWNGSPLLYMAGSSFGVVLIRPGDQSLYHLDLETGLLLHKIALPAVPIPKGKSEWDPCSKLHLTNSGFCYYSTIVQDKEILFGGHLRGGVWQNCFERPLPLGHFSILGPFVSVPYSMKDDQLLTIIDPSNAETVIPHCFDVKIQDGNFYKIIEKNAAGKKERFLSIQPYEPNFLETFSLPDSPAREISIPLYIDEIYSIRKGRIGLQGEKGEKMHIVHL